MALMVADGSGGFVQVTRWGAGSKIDFGATATTSAVLNSQIVRIQAQDADVHVVFAAAADGPAATTETLVSAGVAEYVRVLAGLDVVHVLSATSTAAGVAGSLYITEVV